MSSSFWKFGQDFSSETPISKLLSKAFIKIDDADDEANLDEKVEFDSSTLPEIVVQEHVNESVESGISNDDAILSVTKSPSGEDNEVIVGKDTEANTEHEQDLGESQLSEGGENEEDEDEEDYEDEDKLPDTEAEFDKYKPNLDVLDDLLDDEELYTELMCSNFKLLIYLKYPEVLSKLIDYITCEEVTTEKTEEIEETKSDVEKAKLASESQLEKKTEEAGLDSGLEDEEDNKSQVSQETSVTIPPELEEQIELRRARMAAEVLSAEVWPISSAMMQNIELLNRLWSILDREAPLTIIASTYFMKINERLLDMDITGMLEFISCQDILVERFLKHIDNPPLMDFLLKVISTDKPDAPTGIVNKLKQQGFITKLLDNLNPELSTSTQSAAGDFLKAFITISANSNTEMASGIGPNELTRELVSPEMMEKLINIMLKGSTSLNNGVGIVIELIRKNNSDYDFVQVMYTTLETHPPNDRDPIYLGYLVEQFSKYMPDFAKMLAGSPLPQLETPFGSIEPLGFERFKICELVAELLHCSNMTLLNEPNGYSIIEEREKERERVIKLHLENAEKGVENVDHLQEQINSLKLESATEEKAAENEEEIDSHFDTAAENATESSIRQNPVVGDKLKIVLFDTHIISKILEMFFYFAWNNFLHNVVFDIVQQIFNGPLKTGYNRFLLSDLLCKTNITKMIMEGDKKCVDYEKEIGLRLGYMGHLTLIAEEVAKFAAYIEEMKIEFDDEKIREVLEEPVWKEYTETVLAETREKYNTVLGDFGEEDDDTENRIDDSDENDQALRPDDFISEGVDDNEHITNDGNEDDDDNVLSFDGNNQQMDMYKGFDNSANSQDEYYAEFNDLVDSKYYEYIDAKGNKTRLNSNPNVDYGESQELGNLENEGENSKFSDYMSTQLRNDFDNVSGFEIESNEHPDQHQQENAADDEWNDISSSSFLDKDKNSNTAFRHQFELENGEDDDEYLDPNDDGQSYAKSDNPIYDTANSRNPAHFTVYRNNSEFKDELDDEDQNSENSDSSDAELDDSVDDEAAQDDSVGGCELFRSTSKDKLAWDENEQNTLIEMVNYNRNHGNGV